MSVNIETGVGYQPKNTPNEINPPKGKTAETNPHIIQVASESKKGQYYYIDKINRTCTCPAFKFRSSEYCKHIKKLIKDKIISDDARVRGKTVDEKIRYLFHNRFNGKNLKNGEIFFTLKDVKLCMTMYRELLEKGENSVVDEESFYEKSKELEVAEKELLEEKKEEESLRDGFETFQKGLIPEKDEEDFRFKKDEEFKKGLKSPKNI